jgi:hypothetical protein
LVQCAFNTHYTNSAVRIRRLNMAIDTGELRTATSVDSLNLGLPTTHQAATFVSSENEVIEWLPCPQHILQVLPSSFARRSHNYFYKYGVSMRTCETTIIYDISTW